MKTLFAQAILVFVVSFAVISTAIVYSSEFYAQDDCWYCWDEAGFLVAGDTFFSLFFIGHDFHSEIWKQQLNGYGSVNPRVSLYVLGFFSQLSKNFQKIFPQVEYLIILKVFIALLSSLSTVLFYFLVRISVSSRAAVVAAGLLLCNPFFRSINTAVLLEAPMIFFMFSALLASVYLEDTLRRGFVCWKRTLITGVFTGLAISSKPIAVVLIPTITAIWFLNARQLGLRKVIAGILSWLGASLFIFIFSNPLFMFGFWNGIKELTVNHFQRHSAMGVFFHFESIRFLFVFPFIFYRPHIFGGNICIGEISLGFLEYALVAVGYGLLLAAALILRRVYAKAALASAFLISSFFVTGFIMIKMAPQAQYPRFFLIPSIALIWIWMYLFFGGANAVKRKRFI
ncbi:MAG: phospholipid carrier-dependent glycosyltransferase [Candidatus Omnitrophica bacterium]|nr:phospholipid carrier-dependent glycosyltransferase [Candidatus Omnitrophota bacterium]